MTPRTKVGDIYKIPLPNDKKAYAQFLLKDRRQGNLIRVFDYFTHGKEEADIDKIQKASLLFSPIYTSIKAALKLHNWERIFNIPVKDFKFPNFLNTAFILHDGKAGMWFLYDGEKDIPLGHTLAEKYKKLEFLCWYNPDLIVERIITGEKPQEELINTNIDSEYARNNPPHERRKI